MIIHQITIHKYFFKKIKIGYRQIKKDVLYYVRSWDTRQSNGGRKMQKEVSNYTRIGNTDHPNLVVSDVFSAVEIKQRSNVMTDNKKYSNLKSFDATKTQDGGMELC